jgi:cysteine desulfurase
MIYLDNGASTRPFDDVVALVAEVMRDDFGNPASAHPLGASARWRIERAREQVLAGIGDPAAAAGDLLWTSGGTESDALGILGVANARERGGIVLTGLEHDAVLRSAEQLGEDHEITIVPPDARGTIDVDRLLAEVRPDTAVVALMRVQNEIGTLQPVAEIARAVHERAPACHVHCDAVQALGKVEVDVVALDVDSAAFASHKLHGPKGVGALWVRHGVDVAPLWGGGGHQGGRRAGSLDTPGIAGFGLAVERVVAGLDDAQARWRRFADHLRAEAARGGVARGEVPTELGPEGRALHVVPLAFRDVPAAALRNALASRGVAVSSGSACAERDAKPSRVLSAIGLGADWGMVRVSFGHDTHEADVAAAAAILGEVLRDLAPRTA